MKRLLVGFLLFGAVAWGQLTYTASKTTGLSSSAEVVTVQQPSTGAMVVKFVSAFIDSTVACGVTIEVNGTAATTLALTPAPVLTGQAAGVATAWSGSNVGTGTVIYRLSIPAGGGALVDLTSIRLNGNGTGKNLSVRTASCTGTVDINITYTESNS